MITARDFNPGGLGDAVQTGKAAPYAAVEWGKLGS
jgi:hypothetical protein